jgi:hypothetical protein
MILLQPLDPTSLLFFCPEFGSIKYRGLGTNLPKAGYSVENSICGPPVGTADEQPLDHYAPELSKAIESKIK